MDEGAGDVAVDAPTYLLVYCRTAAVDEEDIVEPLVAVVGSEDEARAIHVDVSGQGSSRGRHPGAVVSWEEWPLIIDTPGVDELEDGRLHIVMSAADERIAGSSEEFAGPIGEAIHSTRRGAEEHAAQLDDGTNRPHGVQSVPAHYRRPGWPFAADAPVPLPGEMEPFDPGRGKRYLG